MPVGQEAERETAGAAFERLVELMRRLRAENGCAWDREQTLESLRPFVIEETYEVVDAIDRRDPAALCDELGDLLLEAVFLAQISAERGDFDVADSLRAICDKLVRRHPHVFGADADGSRALARRRGQAAVGSDQGRGAEVGRPAAEPARVDPRQPAGAAARVPPGQTRRDGRVRLAGPGRRRGQDRRRAGRTGGGARRRIGRRRRGRDRRSALCRRQFRAPPRRGPGVGVAGGKSEVHRTLHRARGAPAGPRRRTARRDARGDGHRMAADQEGRLTVPARDDRDGRPTRPSSLADQGGRLDRSPPATTANVDRKRRLTRVRPPKLHPAPPRRVAGRTPAQPVTRIECAAGRNTG